MQDYIYDGDFVRWMKEDKTKREVEGYIERGMMMSDCTIGILIEKGMEKMLSRSEVGMNGYGDPRTWHPAYRGANDA